jgi:hypothetical protein
MPRDYERRLRVLITNVEDLLASQNARDRVSAIRHIALGVQKIEQQVIWAARDDGMLWDEIARIYGRTKQAMQQRFGSR